MKIQAKITRVKQWDASHQITVHGEPVDEKVDRVEMFGWVVAGQAQADRLAAAINAGVVYKNPVILTDTNGKTYVSANTTVMGRTMNRDLKALGF